MGYTHGFKWTPELLGQIRALKIEGYTDQQICDKFALVRITLYF
jgi:hypothetical protein